MERRRTSIDHWIRLEEDILIQMQETVGLCGVEGPNQQRTLYRHFILQTVLVASPTVAENLQAIALQVRIFGLMSSKVGASNGLERQFACFRGADVQLVTIQTFFIDFLLAGDAGGPILSGMSPGCKDRNDYGLGTHQLPLLRRKSRPFSQAARFMHYGTNDMGLRLTYESALEIQRSVRELSDELLAEGIVPISDDRSTRSKPEANQLVATYKP